MELDQARELVMSSGAGDWQRWEVAGPLTDTSRGGRATYRADVAVELWWGKVITEDFVEPWVEHFPAHDAISINVEATYGGALVLQETFVLVDGGRHIVPRPRIHQEDDGLVEYRVARSSVRLAWTLAGLGAAGHNVDAAIEKAGFVLE